MGARLDLRSSHILEQKVAALCSFSSPPHPFPPPPLHPGSQHHFLLLKVICTWVSFPGFAPCPCRCAGVSPLLPEDPCLPGLFPSPGTEADCSRADGAALREARRGAGSVSLGLEAFCRG